ncbi:dTDP-4-dehydrorhamnose reductase [Ilyobacter polytropus]|uniref:dTDP-4-dehydrorhamnose reductase n=1 Tax=Ilyobacter polytropus (strain ATCC 51220 / DSM 2926 / LMG 16218 / CuHBu1) TaxID=572544 RepID=E3HD78_ILYPC|nr:dTDP-4-dehydrorhamnose reductase [Ilyobacter polytropus]ADO84078.1 dTDP-4-dehydrorhamnose reductase [Ilyobacter polytropus DSM 2926]
MILLTGGKGQLGSEFQKLFKKLGVEYIAPGHREMDITDINAVKNFLDGKNIDFVINCAAYNDVDRAEMEPENCFAVNCLAPENLALESKKIGAVFVTYSSDFVFDGEKKKPYTESDIVNPMSVYSKSKAEGEKRVFTACDKIFVIRTSWVFGTGNNNFVKNVINWSQQRGKIELVEDQVSSPTYAKDLAEYSWKLINSDKYGLYHLSNTGTASKYEEGKYILEKIGWKGELLKVKTSKFNLPAKRPRYSKLSNQKAEKITGKKMPQWKNSIDRFFEEIKEGDL